MENKYITGLKKEYIGYKNETTKTLLSHIKQELVKSTTHERTKALETYHIPWDQVINIMTYKQSLTKAQEKCVDLGIVCDASRKVQIYIEQMCATDVFEQKDFTTWKAKTEANKTWANATKYFGDIYQ